ncbi:MAG: hypothetical protein K6G69_10275 [Lachnospiraceae bacterium]|nr:hypothetical protein [Lachnospiraceae bacterium]
MSVNIFGNINGFNYRTTEINLFETAQQQGNKQPVKLCYTEAGKTLQGIKVNISEEGLRALHGSKLPGSTNIKDQQEELKFYSEHQPLESFENQLSRKMREGLSQLKVENPNRITMSDKENALMNGFKTIADEIFAGYEAGTRVRFVEDIESDDGYRKLSKEDELSLLKQEFDDLVEKFFGEEHQKEAEEVAKALNSFQQIKLHMGSTDIKQYAPEKIPADFIEKLRDNSSQYISNTFDNEITKTLSITSSGIHHGDRAEREDIISKSIVPLEGNYKVFNLTDEEACILKSFRLEEYFDIRNRMKDEDKEAYNNLLKAESAADNNPDPSEKFKVYAKAYNWAYGDIFDKIHKENPDVDVYVKSSGTPENHNYQMRNNRTSLVISTDEIKLLQSKKEQDKTAQDELWKRIIDKITNSDL